MKLEWEATSPTTWRARVINQDTLHLSIQRNGTFELTASWLQTPLRPQVQPADLKAALKHAQNVAAWRCDAMTNDERAMQHAHLAATLAGLPVWSV